MANEPRVGDTEAAEAIVFAPEGDDLRTPGNDLDELRRELPACGGPSTTSPRESRRKGRNDHSAGQQAETQDKPGCGQERCSDRNGHRTR
jgi:hypothetical protein